MRCWRLQWVLVLLGFAAGCEPYRIEHRKLPEFYYKSAAGEIPEKIVLDDGTVLINETADPTAPRGGKRGAPEKPFEIRRELEDGRVELHANRPEHVLTHVSTCVRDGEYKLLFDQMLAMQAKMTWDSDEEGRDGFERFLRSNRRDVLVVINRMLAGINTQDVVVDSGEGGMMRVRLRPQAARSFKFKYVYLASEGGELRLMGIK